MSIPFFCNPHKYNRLRWDKYIKRIGFCAKENWDLTMKMLGFACAFLSACYAMRFANLDPLAGILKRAHSAFIFSENKPPHCPGKKY